MILRMWKAQSTATGARDYIHHAKTKVFPKVRAIEGSRGGYLLSRTVEGGVELAVVTLWQSIDAIRRFAGPEPDKAVIEPEARAVLTSFDEYVTHFSVIDRIDVEN